MNDRHIWIASSIDFSCVCSNENCRAVWLESEATSPKTTCPQVAANIPWDHPRATPLQDLQDEANKAEARQYGISLPPSVWDDTSSGASHAQGALS